MAIGFTAKVKGSRKLAKAFKRLFRDFSKTIEDAVERAALIVEAEAKRRVPLKTARLSRTITSGITDRTATEVRAAVGAGTNYAVKMELGDFKHATRSGFIGKPTKFLFPALIARKSDIVIEIIRATRKAIVEARE